MTNLWIWTHALSFPNVEISSHYSTKSAQPSGYFSLHCIDFLIIPTINTSPNSSLTSYTNLGSRRLIINGWMAKQFNQDIILVRDGHLINKSPIRYCFTSLRRITNTGYSPGLYDKGRVTLHSFVLYEIHNSNNWGLSVTRCCFLFVGRRQSLGGRRGWPSFDEVHELQLQQSEGDIWSISTWKAEQSCKCNYYNSFH